MMAQRGGVYGSSFSPDTVALAARTTFPGGAVQASGWFGPQQPLVPSAPPEVRGRQFDLVPGYNISTRPRGYEPIGYGQLRGLADGYDVLRIIIETRKDQMDRIRWNFRAKKGTKVAQNKIDEITAFFIRPDGEHDFNTWLRMLLEDLFVIDAPTIWKQYNRGGDKLLALCPMDGATIKRVIDDWGRTPKPYAGPDGLIYPTAYQQVLKGFPAVDYTTRDLIYAPRNVRTDRVFGYSPVEQIIMTVNIGLRRELGQLEYYTAGNIPESLIGVPDTWTPDQIKTFQDYWDDYFTGDTAARRKAKFVPGGVAKTFIQTKEPELKNVFDEWLAKICCYAFSVSSQPFVSQVNRATANSQKEQAEEEGLIPVLQWVKRLLDPIVQGDLGEPNIEYVWGDDAEIAPETEAVILNSYADKAIMTRNEVREKLSMDRSDVPEADQLGFTTATGFVALDESLKPEPPAPPMIMGATPLAENDNNLKKPVDAKKASAKSSAQKLDEILDLMKNDTQGEARDERGRFTSSGGPTAREKRKAERQTKDDGIARDEHGRFAPGKITPAAVKTAATKIGVNIAYAAAIAATGAFAVYLLPGSKISAAIKKSSEGMARVLLKDSAEHFMATAFKAMGADAETAKAFAKVVRRTIIEFTKPPKTKKSESSDDMDLQKTAPPTEAEFAVCMMVARTTLPRFAEQLFDALLAHLESEGASAERLRELSSILSGIRDDLSTSLDDVEKMSKRAGVRRLTVLPYDRPAVTKATKRIAGRLGKAFKASSRGLATLVARHLSEPLERVAKALEGTDPRAARIAADLDLSAIEEIYVDLGDDLEIASSDAAHRTLVQIGPDLDTELFGQTSQRAADWAQQHAGKLLGKRVLEDGTTVEDKTDGDYRITDATRDMVGKIVTRGIRDGLTNDEIVQQIEDLGFSEERAQLIADNEVGNANSAGTLQAYSDAVDAGVTVMKGWLTVGDDNVDDEICGPNEEQGPIPIDEPFQSGHMAPLGHTRCRCSLVPYVGDEVQDE
jgi:hypothetical protein